MEPSTIDSILRTFRDVLGDSETSAETKVAILEYMTALPLAARWKTVLLLLSGRERQVVEDVWGLLSDCDATKETLEAWGIS